eukprot:366199-Chlamydomonas_euryale.AAC.24
MLGDSPRRLPAFVRRRRRAEERLEKPPGAEQVSRADRRGGDGPADHARLDRARGAGAKASRLCGAVGERRRRVRARRPAAARGSQGLSLGPWPLAPAGLRAPASPGAGFERPLHHCYARPTCAAAQGSDALPSRTPAPGNAWRRRNVRPMPRAGRARHVQQPLDLSRPDLKSFKKRAGPRGAVQRRAVQLCALHLVPSSIAPSP